MSPDGLVRSSIVNSALSYFRALRARGPADAAHIEDFGLPLGLTLGAGTSHEQARRFHALLKEELADLNALQGVLVGTYLFGPATDRNRQRVARERLTELGETSPHYYRNHCTRALEMYCRRLIRRLENEDAVLSESGADERQPRWWYEVTAMSQELRIDPDDYRRQHWTTTFELRSRWRDHPIVFVRQGWTGSGRREGVVVQSGQGEDYVKRGLEHRLLRERRESDNATSWMLKIFDLGLPLAPGKTTTLCFTQRFFDKDCRFEPYHAWSTGPHHACQRITLAVCIPPQFGVREVRAWEEVPDDSSSTGFLADAPVEIIPSDGSGRFEYPFRDVRPGRRYMVDWSDASYNTARA